MLSPHEFATLKLVKDGHTLKHLDHAELDALHARQLITLERRESMEARASLTSRGDSVLRAAARMR